MFFRKETREQGTDIVFKRVAIFAKALFGYKCETRHAYVLIVHLNIFADLSCLS